MGPYRYGAISGPKLVKNPAGPRGKKPGVHPFQSVTRFTEPLSYDVPVLTVYRAEQASCFRADSKEETRVCPVLARRNLTIIIQCFQLNRS